MGQSLGRWDRRRPAIGIVDPTVTRAHKQLRASQPGDRANPDVNSSRRGGKTPVPLVRRIHAAVWAVTPRPRRPARRPSKLTSIVSLNLEFRSGGFLVTVNRETCRQSIGAL